MNFICQTPSLSELETLAKSNRHSILISGPEGCGKTYLAKQYGKMLSVEDFQIIEPKVDIIKDSIDTCLKLDPTVVLCIENLDSGVSAASYALLKFLEEPLPNVYIVITCRNINNVPDTIISRSAVVSTSVPLDIDISTYALTVNSDRFKELQHQTIWKCVRTFKDADTVLNMNDAQLEYFRNLSQLSEFKDTVSNIAWRLGHYPDNTETPLELVVRYIMEIVKTDHVRKSGIECMRDISQGRIASHAILAKFSFELKYWE